MFQQLMGKYTTISVEKTVYEYISALAKLRGISISALIKHLAENDTKKEKDKTLEIMGPIWKEVRKIKPLYGIDTSKIDYKYRRDY